jgi:predicted DNA-binding protein (UPF0251 family)
MSPIKTEDYILSQDPCTGEYSLTLRNSGETLSITDEVGQYLKKNFYHEQYAKRLHRKKMCSLDSTYSSFDSDSSDLNLVFQFSQTCFPNPEPSSITNSLIDEIRALCTPEEFDILCDLYVLEYTEEECARKYGISRSALNARKRRLLEKIRKKLKFF